MDIDQCAALSRHLESNLDRELEDFELTVTSVGLTSPFKTLRQYKKFEGEEVEVLTKKGEKLSGTLESSDPEGFTVAVTKKVKPEGAKRRWRLREYCFAQRSHNKISNQIQITYMGKKKETISLYRHVFEFNELKNIDKATPYQRARRGLPKRDLESHRPTRTDIIINPTGRPEIWRNRVIVEDDELENPNLQVTLSEALTIDDDFEIGEELTDAVSLDRFGRRTILNLRQTLASKILELEKDNLFNKYKEKVGEIVSGEVYQVWKKEILLLDDEHNELILPKTEQIPSDFFRKGEHVRAVVARVESKNNNPKIILSRTSPVFLERLFEHEIPEIADGLITIKAIARIPGVGP